jgi:hypothetical protein
MSADAGFCGGCGSLDLAIITNATMVPTAYNSRGANLIYDTVTYLGTNYGAWANAASSSYMQALLFEPADDIMGVTVWAGYSGEVASSGYLSIWLSSDTSFNVTGVRCVQGLNVMEQGNASVTCPRMTNVSYVTIERNAPVSGRLVVAELYVHRASE